MGVHDIEPEEHSDVEANKDEYVEDEFGQLWTEYWSITADSVAREIAMDKQTPDNVLGLFSGCAGGARMAWSAEDCWNDIFSGTLEEFQIQHARQNRPWDVEERMKSLRLRTLKSSPSSDGTK